MESIAGLDWRANIFAAPKKFDFQVYNEFKSLLILVAHATTTNACSATTQLLTCLTAISVW